MATFACISAGDIDDGVRARWRELQGDNGQLASPYFSVEYTDAVASVRDDVRVGLVEDDGRIVAIFPHQVRRLGVAEPVGGRMSDYQGLIAPLDADFDVAALMHACDLKVWEFDHLLASQQLFRSHHRLRAESPILELQGGFDEYLRTAKMRRGNHIREIRRRSRKFERDIGTMHLVERSVSETAFRSVIEWKSEQCRRTYVPEFLRWSWVDGLLRRIWEIDEPDFAGVLSVLYADDTILSAHFGMRSASVYHWWFPAYNYEFSAYSPGSILLYRMAQWAADRGMAHLDLGKGDEDYKLFFATRSIAVAEGTVRVPSAIGAMHRARESSELFIRESRYAAPIREPLKVMRDRARASR